MPSPVQTAEELEAHRCRRLRREQRRAARDLARRRVVEELARLLQGDDPEFFTAEQVAAYRAELHRLSQRSAGPSRTRARPRSG